MSAIVKSEGVEVVERTPAVIAAEIRFIDSQARQYMLQTAIEIGKRLIEAKEQLPHGEWGKWLKDNVSYSQSTANNFMRVATEYGNSPSFTNLSYTQAVALLAVPQEEREAFVEEVNASEMSSRELAAAIRRHQEEEAKRKELEKELEAERERLRKEQEALEEEVRKREALYEQYQQELKLRQSQEQKLNELNIELEQAKNSGNKAELSKIKAQLRQTEKAKQEQEAKVAELQKQIEAAKEAEAQRFAEELKKREQELLEQAKAREAEQAKQLAELKKQTEKLSQQLERANNEQFLRAKIALDQMIKDGEALVKAIAAVKNPDEQGKLKTAAGTVVDKLRSML